MKHKKLMAILLSLAIMVTFMPMMAFAASETPAGNVGDWGTADKYAVMTDTNTPAHQFKAKYQFGSDAASDGVWDVTGWDGIVKAVVSDDDTSVVGHTYKAPADNTRYFYDFDGSAFSYDTTALDKKTITGDTWTALKNGNLKITLVAQNYGNYSNYSASKAATKAVALGNATKNDADGTYKWTASLGNWAITVVAEGYDEKKSSENQTVTLKVTEVTASAASDAKSSAAAQRVGAMPTATITVQGTPATPQTAEFYFDSVGGTKSADGVNYDGAAHKVVATPVEGWTVSFKVYDKTKGDYVAKDEVSLTNVETVNFVAVWKKSGATTVEKQGTAKINAMTAPGFGFDMTQSVNDEYAYFNVEGTEYNAADFLAIKPYERQKSSSETSAETDARLAMNAASKAAVEANKTELVNYIADFYEVKATTLKSDSADVKLDIVSKTLTSAEKTALEKKYEQLMKNFGITSTPGIGVTGYSWAKVWLNAEKIDEEIEFTTATSNLTVHVKKAKSLKKAKTIKFKAVSNKGRTVSYKLIDANSKIKIDKTTGTVTLKKGLKKGTYKFYVKAYVPGKGLWETQFVTVKIKK